MMYSPLPNSSVIGTCSLCGGPVLVPLVYHCITPPTPTCARCGATKALPVIKMTPRLVCESSKGSECIGHELYKPLQEND